MDEQKSGLIKKLSSILKKMHIAEADYERVKYVIKASHIILKCCGEYHFPCTRDDERMMTCVYDQVETCYRLKYPLGSRVSELHEVYGDCLSCIRDVIQKREEVFEEDYCVETLLEDIRGETNELLKVIWTLELSKYIVRCRYKPPYTRNDYELQNRIGETLKEENW